MTPNADDTAVELQLLGRFEVKVGERVIGGDAWPSRRSGQLVQLLALAKDQSLSRDQVIEALWPHLKLQAAAANLRKAAHHARRALDAADAVVLRQDRVALFPGLDVRSDLAEFVAAADSAVERGDARAAAVAAVAVAFKGDLLPESLYEEWTQEARRHLRNKREQVLRLAGCWEELLGLDPADETAYRALMRAALDAGNRHAAVQWYGRLRAALFASSVWHPVQSRTRCTRSASRGWDPGSRRSSAARSSSRTRRGRAVQRRTER